MMTNHRQDEAYRVAIRLQVRFDPLIHRIYAASRQRLPWTTRTLEVFKFKFLRWDSLRWSFLSSGARILFSLPVNRVALGSRVHRMTNLLSLTAFVLFQSGPQYLVTLLFSSISRPSCKMSASGCKYHLLNQLVKEPAKEEFFLFLPW